MELGRWVGGTAFAVQLRLEWNLDGSRRYGIARQLLPGAILFGSAIHVWKFKADITRGKRSAVY